MSTKHFMIRQVHTRFTLSMLSICQTVNIVNVSSPYIVEALRRVTLEKTELLLQKKYGELFITLRCIIKRRSTEPYE